MIPYTIILGGNQGNVELTFLKTMNLLSEIGHIRLRSEIYCSNAWGYESDSIYFNQVISIDSNLEPESFLDAILDIELNLGRVRNENPEYIDRIIDIDILFIEQQIIETEKLHIPHPRLHLRKFCLEPLNEIMPEFTHPILKKSVAELLFICEDKSTIWKMI